MSKYLFIAAHVDDVELSCGGFIYKLISEEHFVHVISFTEMYDGVILYNEFEKSMKTLGVEYYQTYQYETRDLCEHRKEIADLAKYWVDGVDFVYTHSTGDRHPDHRTVAEEVKRVCNGNLMTFICPWNGQHEENYFVDITESQLSTKVESLLCYKSQVNRGYMEPDFIRAQARYNGVKCSKLYAEAFKVERLVF